MPPVAKEGGGGPGGEDPERCWDDDDDASVPAGSTTTGLGLHAATAIGAPQTASKDWQTRRAAAVMMKPLCSSIHTGILI